jgi:hypothetical protein
MIETVRLGMSRRGLMGSCKGIEKSGRYSHVGARAMQARFARATLPIEQFEQPLELSRGDGLLHSRVVP